MKTTISLILLLLSQPTFALSPGKYESHNGNTGSLSVSARGSDFLITSCAKYDGIGCASFEIDLIRSGDGWSGTGTLTAAYRGDASFDCPYEIESRISENEAGELFLSLRLPRTMYANAYTCPTIQALGGYQWFNLSGAYRKQTQPAFSAH